MRLIDADEMIKRLQEWNTNDGMDKALYNFTMSRILEQPTIEPERKTGTFIGTEYDGYADGNPVFCEWKCSECGCVFEDEEPTYNFCPNCGSDMRGKNNEAD